jgi:LysM repeat protein
MEYDVFVTGPGNREVYLNNGLQFIILKDPDNLRTIAAAFGVTEKRLLKWNDLKKGAKLVPGQMVYLEPKKKKGAATYYIVTAGETMYTISQRNGITLKMLYKRNRMKPGNVPHAGQKILLR